MTHSAATAREGESARSFGRLDTALVLGLTVLAFILRWFFATRSGLWRDEALFLSIVRFPGVGDILAFLQQHESHPPLFYLLMRGWLRITGGSDRAALALPAALGAAIVPAVFMVGRRVFGRPVALTAALFAAVSGSLAENAGLARPYSLLPLLTLLSTYALWRLLYDPCASKRRVVLAVYIGSTAALVYTHNWSWLVVGAEWGVFLFTLSLQGQGSMVGTALRWTHPVSRIAREWLISQVALFVLYSPWLLTLLRQFRYAGHGPAGVPGLFPALAQVATVAVPLPYDYALIAWLIVGAAGVWGLFQAVRRRPRDASREGNHLFSPLYPAGLTVFLLVPLVALAAAVAFSVHTLLLLPRCLVMLAPDLLLVFTALLLAVPGRASVRLVLASAVTVGMVFLTFVLLGEPRSNARELAAAVMRDARPDDLIVISPEQVGLSFNHYYAGENEQIDFPEHRRQEVTGFDHWPERVGRPEALADTLQTLDGAHKAGRRVWMVVLYGRYQTDLAPDASLPPDIAHSIAIGGVRTSQILTRLVRLYGRPSKVYLPGISPADVAAPDFSSSSNDEVEEALLFSTTAETTRS